MRTSSGIAAAPDAQHRHLRASWLSALLSAVLVLALLAACTPPTPSPTGTPSPTVDGGEEESILRMADQNADERTRSLFLTLREARGTNTIVGQYTPTEYGITVNDFNGVESDIRAAVEQHPAIFNWDTNAFYGLVAPGVPRADRGRNVTAVASAIRRAYSQGAIPALSGQPPVFYSASDVTPKPLELLPGGRYNSDLTSWLDLVAEVISQSTDAEGRQIPVIFRPVYAPETGAVSTELAASGQSYLDVYRYMVSYLRDTVGLHSVLYAFGVADPNITTLDELLTQYPGDDFVDIIEVSDTMESAESTAISASPEDQRQQWFDNLSQTLAITSDFADERGKVSALGSVGVAGGIADTELTGPTWFTQLAGAITANTSTARTAYLIFGANYSRSTFHVPYAATDSGSDGEALNAHPLLVDFETMLATPNFALLGDLSRIWDRTNITTHPHSPSARFISPQPLERITGTSVKIRAVVTGISADTVLVATGTGQQIVLQESDTGYYEGIWEIDSDILTNRTETLNLVASNQTSEVSADLAVILGKRPALPADVFEDFEGYGDNAALEATLVSNTPIALERELVGGGEQALAIEYDLSQPATPTVSQKVSLNWQTFDGVQFWYRPDGSANSLQISLVSDDVAYHATVELSGRSPQDLELAWDQFTGPTAGIPTPAHLGKITEVRLSIVGKDLDGATQPLLLDEIRAWTAPPPPEDPEAEITSTGLVE